MIANWNRTPAVNRRELRGNFKRRMAWTSLIGLISSDCLLSMLVALTLANAELFECICQANTAPTAMLRRDGLAQWTSPVIP